MDVLRQERLRAPLLEALGSVDRLVLLGDVLELRHGPVREALTAASGVLAEVGQALGAGSEVVIVPGNHDHHLGAAWLERRARRRPPPLGLESAVDWRAGEALAKVAQALAPAEVSAAYPGIWLREDVYATHGHYLDRHTTVPMLERLGAGATARIVGEAPGGPERAEDYEAVLAPVYAWIHAIAQAGGPRLGSGSHGASGRAWQLLQGSRGPRTLRRRGAIVAFPAVIAALNRTPLGPLRADLSGPALRRAALVAFDDVLERLDVHARHVVFGHTHRAGPLPRDECGEWVTSTGGRVMNSGSWVHEPHFLGDAPDESPYRAGFSVRIDGDAPPQLSNLMDDTR